MSEFKLADGTGKGNIAGVNEENQLLVRSIQEPSVDNRTNLGHSYNFNTGAPFDVGANDSSAVLFFKNTDTTYNLIITAFIYNLGIAAGAATDGSEFSNIVIVRNPTSISSGTDIAPVNRNHGSSNTLVGTFQKGAGGATFAGGDDMIETLIASSSGGRSFIGVGAIILQPQNSIGVRYEAHTSTTQQYVQFASALYLDKPF